MRVDLTMARLAAALFTLAIVPPASAANGTGGIPRVVDDVAVLQESVDVLQMEITAISEALSDLIDTVNGMEEGSATGFLDVTGAVCFDVGLGVAPKFTNSTRARIEIEGGVGVDVYGNGVEVDLEPVNDSKFDLGLGLKANATGRICVNLGVLKFLEEVGALSAGVVEGADPDAEALKTEMRVAQAAMRDALPDILNNVGLQPSNVPALFEAVQGFDFDLTNPARMVAEGPQKIQELVAIMPMPPRLRNRLASGASPFETIAQQLADPRDAICNNLSALPPAVADRLDSICSNQTGQQLANTINGIKSTVDGVNQVVNNIKNALPTADDCKFFCSD
jgi:hypothetical protein